MKFELLPEIPQTWSDFLGSSLAFPPASRALPALLANADAVRNRTFRRDDLCRRLAREDGLCFDRTLQNLQKLRQPEAVVVMTRFYPGLFGGPAFQLFKCLTAIKLCEELALHKLQAVPVCWISHDVPRTFSKWSVRILNSESELCSLELEQQEASDFLPQGKVAALLARIEESGSGNYDLEVLEIIKSSFGQETTLAGASARLVAALMKEWGIVILDPRSPGFREAGFVPHPSQNALPAFLMPCSILPVLATVIDPFEVDSFVLAQPVFKEHNLAGPMAWPQASATIIDSRSRRALERYGLDLKRLYGGADAIIGEIMAALPRGTSEKLENLKLEAETAIVELGALDPAGSSFAKAAGSGRKKIAFQLDRLRQKYDAACRNKEQTVRRHIRRACNSLAPGGRIQEWELAGIQMPLRYSRAVLQSLYEKLDILSLEHQLISME